MFLVAVSPDESGEDALDWLMSELVEDGDELIAMRVVDMGDEGGYCTLFGANFCWFLSSLLLSHISDTRTPFPKSQ